MTLSQNAQLSLNFGLMLVICAMYTAVFSGLFVDDAYITFAYARNFAEQGQLVLRAGSTVDAMSSYLWALLLGVASSIALSPPAWSKVFGCIFSFMTICVVANLFSRESRVLQTSPYVCLAAALPFGFALWGNYGMENSLVSLLCFLAVLRLPRPGVTNDLIVVPLLMLGIHCARPEGFGYVAALYACEILRRVWFKQSARWLYLGIAILAALVLGYELFIYRSYGVFLPDSATAKLNQGILYNLYAGLKYTFNRNNVLITLLVPASVVLLCLDIYNRRLKLDANRHASLLLGGVLAVATIAFVFVTGGDWMPAARFYALVLPFSGGYVVWSLFAGRLPERKYLLLPVMSLLAASQIFVATRQLPALITFERAQETALQEMVDDLNKVAVRQDTLSLSDIGRASYGFRGNIFDWWGIASRIVTARQESLGRIRSATLLLVNPEFLVVYAKSRDGPRADDVEPLGMAAFSQALVTDASLMDRYCRLEAYYYSDDRYHVLLARKDVWSRFRASTDVPRQWAVSSCVHPIYDHG